MAEDGNFWFTLSNSSNIARATPRGTIKYSRTPTLSNPAFITPGPDGNIWFGEGSTGKIASVTPDGVITEYQFSFFGVSVGITTGSDGNIWFTDQTDHAVWRFEIATDTFTEFRTPHTEFLPRRYYHWLRSQYVVHRAGRGQIRPNNPRWRDHRIYRTERSDLYRRWTRWQSLDCQRLHATDRPSDS